VLYKLMVVLHMLGACVWIGGHAVLIAMVLPRALRHNDPGPILDFERDYGRLGLAALIVQLVTGLWLANRWVGSWSTILSEPTAQGHLVLAKLTVLIITVALAGYTFHRVLPHVAARRFRAFVLLSGTVTMLAILMLILGVGIRTGGLR